MLDLQRYAFYDAKRTMRLTLEPVSILEMLQDLPGELLFSAPLPAARLGVPCASPDVMRAAILFVHFLKPLHSGRKSSLPKTTSNSP